MFYTNILDTVSICIRYIMTKRNEFLFKQKMRLGQNIFFGTNVIIDPVYPWLISIGDECTLTNDVIILAHDASTNRHLGYTKVGKVSIGKKTFIGVRSIILPNVKIGENVIIGAGSVVTHDIPDNSIAAGNPAIVIGSTSEYIKKHQECINLRPVYKKNKGETSKQVQKAMKDELHDGIGYTLSLSQK